MIELLKQIVGFLLLCLLIAWAMTRYEQRKEREDGDDWKGWV